VVLVAGGVVAAAAAAACGFQAASGALTWPPASQVVSWPRLQLPAATLAVDVDVTAAAEEANRGGCGAGRASREGERVVAGRGPSGSRPPARPASEPQPAGGRQPGKGVRKQVRGPRARRPQCAAFIASYLAGH